MADFPIKNIVYEKIKVATSLTDADLIKALTKSGTTIPDDKFNKIYWTWK